MLVGLFSCCFLFLFSEVQKQSDILSGQAGDTAEGTTMELPACLMGTTSSLEQRRTAETHPFFFSYVPPIQRRERGSAMQGCALTGLLSWKTR